MESFPRFFFFLLLCGAGGVEVRVAWVPVEQISVCGGVAWVEVSDVEDVVWEVVEVVNDPEVVVAAS